MNLTTVYRVFRIVREGGLPVPHYILLPIREGNNQFDLEEESIDWIKNVDPQQRYTEFVVLPVYSMV